MYNKLLYLKEKRRDYPLIFDLQPTTLQYKVTVYMHSGPHV